MNVPFPPCILRLAAAAAILLGTVAPASAQTPSPRPLSAKTKAQIDAIKADVAARTPVQRKITWSLLYASKEKATKAAPVPGAPKLHSRLALEGDGRVKVKITAVVTPELLAMIHAQGGDVTGSFPKNRVVYATLPLESLETIAARPDVEFIGRPATVDFNGGPQASLRQALGAPVQSGGSVNDPEGDAAHGANVVRTNYGTTGAGLKVAVISNSLDNAQSDYENALLNGYVSSVTVPPGQAGSNTEDGEGLAMLEVVHRLAPGAQLFFATADNGEEQMAANINSLVADGCNIIIDDIAYSDESPFQPDAISQAVQAASAAGVLYFSCAANYGNLDSGTSSCWEGDFIGTSDYPNYLDFESGTPDSPLFYNEVFSYNDAVDVWMFWAEPIGGATSSYFIFETDSADEIVQSADDTGSTPNQVLTDFSPGDNMLVEKISGNADFLHIDVAAQNSSIAYATSGRVRGHNAAPAANAFTVAATPAAASFGSGDPTGPYPNQFTSANEIEPFSDDGPRRIFFLANGTPITPGNSTSTGGQLFAKPDFTAADGVSTSDGQIDPFFGTSCAAPHAGALAALLLSYKPTLTPTQIGAALRAGTVQITNPGAGNRNAGAGILLAPNIIQVVNTPPSILNFSPANGPAGTIVTITGINLNTATLVTFNGVPAPFSIVSGTALTATVPAGATTGPIGVQTAGGVAGSSAAFTLTQSVSTPVISSATAATGTVGSAFSYQITATNGPTTFGAAGLPGGLVVNAAGLISGVPTTPGAFPVTISAGNASGGTSATTLALTIRPAPPVITNSSSAVGQVGVAFGFQISASNTPTGFSATGLPPGLILTATNGVISGVPVAAGTFSVTVTASNSGGASAATLTITVLPATPAIVSALSAQGVEGVAFNYTITATNGATSFGATGLPPGLALNPGTGLISGTPTAAGEFPVMLAATNAGGTGGATLALTIQPPPLPAVSIKAMVPAVQEGSNEVGVFVLTLSKAVTKPTVVSYTIMGTAINGQDYVMLSDTKTIKAGKTSKTINIVPKGTITGTEFVKLVIEKRPGYVLGRPHMAKVKIIGD